MNPRVSINGKKACSLSYDKGSSKLARYSSSKSLKKKSHSNIKKAVSSSISSSQLKRQSSSPYLTYKSLDKTSSSNGYHLKQSERNNPHIGSPQRSVNVIGIKNRNSQNHLTHTPNLLRSVSNKKLINQQKINVNNSILNSSQSSSSLCQKKPSSSSNFVTATKLTHQNVSTSFLVNGKISKDIRNSKLMKENAINYNPLGNNHKKGPDQPFLKKKKIGVVQNYLKN